MKKFEPPQQKLDQKFERKAIVIKKQNSLLLSNVFYNNMIGKKTLSVCLLENFLCFFKKLKVFN